MADVEKRRKVIRVLTCAANHADEGMISLSVDEVREIVELLRVQEARVMTVEEARETLHTAEFLYCEDKNDDTRAGGLLRGVLNGSGYWDLINGEYMTPDCLDEGEDLELEYGKTFRFWTSRPSPEQMRDTKWEGEKE